MLSKATSSREARPEVWFIQLEAQFASKNITAEETKFNLSRSFSAVYFSAPVIQLVKIVFQIEIVKESLMNLPMSDQLEHDFKTMY